jgi:tryptophanyl-tRNA synthetase
MQYEHDCYFFIADYHSLTTHPKPESLQQNVKNILAEYLACGLNPDYCTLYIQSDLPQIPELYLLLGMHAYKGELERVASFKEKAKSQPDNVNAGLLTYPVLMAADILIHKATKVPVGKDQEQHLEMARTFGNRFNRIYQTEIFPEPVAFNFGSNLIKIPGLNGSGKMSKSQGESSVINLIDSADEITKKIKRAVTDSGPVEKNATPSVAVQNLFDLMAVVSDISTLNYFKESYANCTIKYGDLKKQLAEDMIKFITPIREKIIEISNNEKLLAQAARSGAEKAFYSAERTLKEVRNAIGIRKIYLR